MTTTAIKYTIQPGDTYSKIAHQLSACSAMSTDDLMSANPDVHPLKLRIGQKLKTDISNHEGLIYVVRPGDTFSEIALGLRAASGVTAAQIESANPGITPTALQIGALIHLPSVTDKNVIVTTPTPTPKPEPTPIKTTSHEEVDAEIIGYWDWTWHEGTGLPHATLGIAFSGWADIDTALQQSRKVKAGLVGSKYICIGGGNENGSFTLERVNALVKAIGAGSFTGYQGIALDIEEGAVHLEIPLTKVFKVAKEAGLMVLVTVSHSAPFGVSDAGTLMHSFFNDHNIDILSPQLYTTGKEVENNYATSHHITWSDYASCNAAVAPSIVKASLYASAQTYFRDQGVELSGYIQWSNS